MKPGHNNMNISKIIRALQLESYPLPKLDGRHEDNIWPMKQYVLSVMFLLCYAHVSYERRKTCPAIE